MLKHLLTNPRTLPTRLFLVVGLLACLGWLALWCFRQPLPRRIAPAANSFVLAGHHQKESNAQASAPRRMAGADAIKFLDQTGEGQSLTAATR